MKFLIRERRRKYRSETGITLWLTSYSPIFDSTGHGTVRTRGKYLLQRRKTGIPVRERALLTDPTWCVRRRSPLVRPRNIRFVLCAIAERIRSLHDLPLLDPARSLIHRYSDLLIANNASHTGHRLYLRPHIDMTTFPSMRKSMSRVEKRTVRWRARRRNA